MIKKFLFSIFSLILMSSALFAETDSKESVKEGVKEALTEQKNQDQINLDGKFGFTAQTGFFIFSESDLMQMVIMGFEYHISNTVSIKPSVGFSFSSPESKNKMTGSTSHTDMKTIAGSLALHYHFFKPGRSFIPYIGLQGEFVRYEENYRNAGGTTEDQERTNYINGFLKLGAKYMFTSNFGLFSDIAVGFSVYNQNLKTIKLSDYSLQSETEKKDFMVLSKKAFLGAVFYF